MIFPLDIIDLISDTVNIYFSKMQTLHSFGVE